MVSLVSQLATSIACQSAASFIKLVN
jgi:hypothetical protein